MFRALLLSVALAATSLMGATSAHSVASPLSVTTINYDVDGAAELAVRVDEAIAIWNERLKNVRFVKGPGGIAAATLDRGPAPGLASCLRCTKGSVKFYRENIKDKKAGVLRVIVHEFGHILGLEHPAQLHQESEVMSGGPFTQPLPSAKEVTDADALWTGTRAPSRSLPADHDSLVFGS